MNYRAYACTACLCDAVVAGRRVDFPLCPQCSGEMVEITGEIEALVQAWADTQPGVAGLGAGGPAKEGASNTFHSVSN